MKQGKHRSRFEGLKGTVSYRTVERWWKLIPRDWRLRSIETIQLPQNSSHQGSHTKDQKKIKGR